MTTAERERLQQALAPQVQEAGWYPDPLGSTAERYWDGEWMELTRSPRVRLSTNGVAPEEAQPSFRLPGFARIPTFQLPTLSKEAREQRLREREQLKQRLWVEAQRETFFQTPAGRARLAFERGQHLFQYELELDRVEPTLIPGHAGASGRTTSDPVDILNSVVVEGWKLVDGKFFYAEGRGVFGLYLFRRSKKRRQRMNDPWQP
jgi:Protein of unknown function (DUF2510)